jgi:hypothetical protein
MPVSVRKAPGQELGAQPLMQSALHSAAEGVELRESASRLRLCSDEPQQPGTNSRLRACSCRYRGGRKTGESPASVSGSIEEPLRRTNLHERQDPTYRGTFAGCFAPIRNRSES